MCIRDRVKGEETDTNETVPTETEPEPDVYKRQILGIESSCDDTSAAVIKDGYLLSNVVSSQAVHEAYGGVVPELASRAHQQKDVYKRQVCRISD